MLRYDPPVQNMVRMHTNAVGGTEIPAGTPTFLLLAAANGVTQHNSGRLEVGREPNEHGSFGEEDPQSMLEKFPPL